MNKIFLVVACLFITVGSVYSDVYYYGTNENEIEYIYDQLYYKSEVPQNNAPIYNNNSKRSGYSIRLILSGYDDVVLELTSTSNINNDIYLLFAGGVLKQMNRYSNNVYYYIFENYMDLDALIIANDRNIFMENNFKSQLQNDYLYLVGIINNRYYRDKYYKDYNKYKR